MTFDGWNDELYHHGIKGQKWGIKRFQNEDGSLTPLGRARYLKAGTNELNRRGRREASKLAKSKKQEDFEALSGLTKSLSAGLDSMKKNSYSEAVKELSVKKGLLKATNKKARKLSDEQLKNAVNRLKLEKEFRQLSTEQNKSMISSGAEVVSSILRRSVENIGTQLVTYGLGALANKIAKKEIVNPKKGQKDK